MSDHARMQRAKPILMSGPMVRALIEGRKTQTRRTVRFPTWADSSEPLEFDGDHYAAICRDTGCFANLSWTYGKPGDLLWVRETWFDTTPFATAPLFAGRPSAVAYKADDEVIGCHKWRSPIFMPRESSRLTLRINEVRVQRLQDCGEDDAKAEGVEAVGNRWKHYFFPDEPQSAWEFAANSYASLWDRINGAGSWDANPWVWALSFEVIRANVDAVASASGRVQP